MGPIDSATAGEGPTAASAQNSAVVAPRLTPEGLQALDAKAAANVAAKVYPGAVYMVTLRGKTAYAGSVGVSNIERGTAMRQGSIFRLASMSKPITAVAIMILVDEGKVRLDDPVARYVPELAHMKVGRYVVGTSTAVLPAASLPITLRDILTHSSGIERDPDVTKAIVTTLDQRDNLAARIVDYAAFPLAWEPGSKFS